MASQTASTEGLASDQSISHYLRLAQSQAALIFVEYTYIHKSGRSENNQMGIDRDDTIEGLSKIARAIQSTGALAGIQLTHSGAKSSRDLTNGVLLGPSPIAVPVKGTKLENPDEMSKTEIKRLINQFTSATNRAVKAGFDVIELHSAHGYGLNQFLSPITNRRNDSFGGKLKKRLKVIESIILSIKKDHSDIVLSVRIPGQDHHPEGQSLDEGVAIAKHLESLGVDIINVSSGMGGWRRPSHRTGQGYLVPDASEIQKHLRIPAIGVGGIQDGVYIDSLISTQQLALTAVGRAILKDPSEWALKNMRKEKVITRLCG